jgi:ankyrin repeat protein
MAIRRCVLMLLAMAALHTRGAAFLLPVFGRKCFSGRICSTEERRQQSLVKMQDASWTPLHRAAQKGNLEMGRLLLCDKKTSVDVRTDEGISPLYVALENGYFSFAQLLIENGADINAQTLKGRTLLHMGAARGLMQVAKMLLKHGCEIDALTTHDHTPLHLAVEYGHLDMVCLLLEAGASPHARDNLQQQPLHLAAGQTKSGAPDLVTALLQQGAPVNDVCARGLTPLDIAVYRDAPLATINALLRAPGAKVSPHDWNNQTALHAAAFLGRQNMVDMLVEHGSRPDARMHLQTGDGLRERAHGFFQGRLGLSSLLALQAAYGMAAREAGSEMDAHVELAALLRLGEVQARVEARSEHTRTGEAVVASAGEAEGAADVFRQAWRRQKGKEGVGAEDAYVAARMRLALTEHSAGVGGSGAVQLEDLCVRLDEAGGLEKAVGVWRAQGVVVFPALIAPHVVAGLRQFVRGVCASTNSASTSSAPPHPVEAVTEATPHRGVVDRSMNIRNPTHRTLRALGVEERPEVLEAIADALGPFLEAALHDSRLLVLEHAVYAIRPGAAAQVVVCVCVCVDVCSECLRVYVYVCVCVRACVREYDRQVLGSALSETK